VTDHDDPAPAWHPDLTPDEAVLITYYRRLRTHVQRQIFELIQELTPREDEDD